MKKAIRNTVRVIMTAAAMLCIAVLCGCNSEGGILHKPAPAPDLTTVRQVYSDSGVTIEMGDMHTVPPAVSGSDADCCLLFVRLTNSGTESVAISSQLCIEVSSGGAPCQCISPKDSRITAVQEHDSFPPLDGLVRPGETREGYIAFVAPADSTAFDFRMALDYADNVWVEFSF
ncbi:MAG: hypothetical protein E7559_09775 [Ruminococcaceae bacterium]|nr:hypothetical protein [Oscillospiraceae bacterium]